jgi:iron-sulfur cluster assembly protein
VLRVGVRGGGCSGMSYFMDFDTSSRDGDTTLEVLGVKVVIDPKSLKLIDGTELDFVREGLNEGFKFHNPREKDRCGCGESFRV